jgi:hypothetical protein
MLEALNWNKLAIADYGPEVHEKGFRERDIQGTRSIGKKNLMTNSSHGRLISTLAGLTVYGSISRIARKEKPIEER